MRHELQIQAPDGQMQTLPLTGGRVSVGRSSAAELCFDRIITDEGLQAWALADCPA